MVSFGQERRKETKYTDDDGMDEEDEVFFAMDNTPALRSDVEEEKEDEQGGRNRTVRTIVISALKSRIRSPIHG